jgi:hypothetical protein
MSVGQTIIEPAAPERELRLRRHLSGQWSGRAAGWPRRPSLAPPTEMTDIAGRGRRVGVPDMPSDIGEVEALFGVEHGNGRRSPGVGPQPGWIQSGGHGRGRHRLRDGLP